MCDAAVGGDIALIEARDEFVRRLKFTMSKKKKSEQAISGTGQKAAREEQSNDGKKTIVKAAGGNKI